MKPIFILFLVAHLLIDLALPWLPGAHRFNPDESVVGIRVQPVQAHELPASLMDPLPASVSPSRTIKIHTGSYRHVKVPVMIAFLPRRDPAPDRSAKRSAEDH